jgi:GNAT superfamily N-acetyltransferase
MAIAPEEFKDKIKAMVRAHYAANRAPLLLAHLGTDLDKADAWPSDRGQRSLKQLIKECAGPELEVVWDKRSPAYVAVVTPDVREAVLAQIEDRLGNHKPLAVRLEDIARPVLLAFCIDARDQPVYVRRSWPFKYEIGNLPTDRASEFIHVEPEYRRAGLRVDHLQSLPVSDRRDLEARILKWASVHGLQIEQFSRLDQDEKDVGNTGKTALDRLLAAQPQDIAQRLMIPADIAQILSRIR